MDRITSPRRHRFLVLATTIGLLAAVAPLPLTRAAAGPVADSGPDAPVDRYIVRLDVDAEPEAEISPAERAEQRAEIDQAQGEVGDVLEDQAGPDDGGEVVADFDNTPFTVVEATPAEVAALEASPAVDAVVPDRLAETHVDASNDQINAPDVWPTTQGSGQTVAIIDTGVDGGHDFLTGKVVHEACYADDNGLGGNTVGDCPNGQDTQTGAGSAVPCADANCNHGTHVAGIAASADPDPNPPGDHRGVAPGADIMAIQVFHDAGSESRAWFSDIALGLEHVYNERNNFDIAAANLSLGAVLFDDFCDDFDGGAMATQVANLRSVGIPTISSSGNDGQTNQMTFPACLSEVISVGNVLTDKAGPGLEDAVSSSSNATPFLRLLAPGSPITSAVPDATAPRDDIEVLSGTSMAAAQVSGALALLSAARAGDLSGMNGPDTVDYLHGWLNAAGPPDESNCITDPGSGEKYRRIDIDAAVNHTALPSALFWDVPPCSWYERAVDWIAHDPDGSGTGAEPIANGFNDGTYRADLDITRAQVARMVWRLLGEQATAHEHPFTDVDPWVEDAVDWLNDPAGPAAPNPLMVGFGDNTFRPDDPITRGQVARLLHRALGSPPGPFPDHGFSDVPPWLEDAVKWIAHDPDGGVPGDGSAEPVATGYKDNTFRPDNPITRAELTRMLFRFNDQLP